MIFLTPGPTKTQQNLKAWLNEAVDKNITSLSHRASWFEEMFGQVTSKIKKIANIPSDYVVAFSGAATEIWERSIQNLVLKESFHIINGEFSQRHSNFSKRLKRKNHECILEVTFNEDLDSIDVPNTSEIICFAQNETSTGMMFPSDSIKKLAKKYPDKLICADIVSAIPGIDLDYSFIDCAYFSVQKGFGLPAGLGCVILSPKAIERSKEIEKSISVGTYHSFPTLVEHALKNQTPETPNILGIWLLNKALDVYLEEGIKNLQNRTQKQKEFLSNELSKFRMSSVVTDPRFQSSTVLAISTNNRAKELKKYLETNKILVGGGYGKFSEDVIRIANFPMHASTDHSVLLDALKKF
jgi:phosphoserine aminotransferase